MDNLSISSIREGITNMLKQGYLTGDIYIVLNRLNYDKIQWLLSEQYRLKYGEKIEEIDGCYLVINNELSNDKILFLDRRYYRKWLLLTPQERMLMEM